MLPIYKLKVNLLFIDYVHVFYNKLQWLYGTELKFLYFKVKSVVLASIHVES